MCPWKKSVGWIMNKPKSLSLGNTQSRGLRLSRDNFFFLLATIYDLFISIRVVLSLYWNWYLLKLTLCKCYGQSVMGYKEGMVKSHWRRKSAHTGGDIYSRLEESEDTCREEKKENKFLGWVKWIIQRHPVVKEHGIFRGGCIYGSWECCLLLTS